MAARERKKAGVVAFFCAFLCLFAAIPLPGHPLAGGRGGFAKDMRACPGGALTFTGLAPFPMRCLPLHLCCIAVVLTLAPGRAQPASAAESAKTASGSRVFRAGAATSNVTPPLGMSVSGVIGQRGVAQKIHDELHARCLVLDDGTTRIALVIVDNTMISRDIFERAKQRVEKAIGFPANRILTAATHTHSTPVGIVVNGSREEQDYHEFLVMRIADGIRRAVDNLAPASIGWGSFRAPEYVFNRRWVVKPDARIPNPFGETTDQVQMNPPAASAGLVEPAGPVDPEVFVLSLRHADGRPLAVLANYGLHYVGGTGGAVSADYFGAFGEKLRSLLAPTLQDPPFVAMMSNGTSGDVNAIDFSRPIPRPPPYERIQHVAARLAAEARRVCESIEHHAWVPLGMAESDLPLRVRRPTPERLARAENLWQKSRGKSQLDRRAVYARETLEVAKYPAAVPVKLQAIRIGSLGIASVPCEVFAATGLQIKERSPLRQTFTISLANGYNGYLPTPRDHERGGYETWLARSSYLEVNASELIRDEVLRLLTTVTAEGGSRS